MMGAWDGKLYLAGGNRGEDNYKPDDRVDVYDIATDTWTAGGGTPMPAATVFAAWKQAGPYLYIAGGVVGDGYSLHNETQRYNMATGDWELGPPLTIPQWAGTLAVTAQRLYILGGSDSILTWNPLDKVDVLELADWPGGAWADLGDPLPVVNISPATACTGAMAGGEIWATGGSDAGSNHYDDNLYRPAEPCVSFGVSLAPESLAGEGSPGETVEYTLTLTNTGTITDYYQLSTTTTWPAALPLGGPGPVGAGESIQVVIAVDVPPDAQAGDQGLTEVTAASIGNPAQSASAALTTTALPVYGLSLAPDSLSGAGLPGEMVTYTLQLTNTGNTTDTFDLAFSGNAWDVHLPLTQTTLASGASTALIAHVFVSAEALAGEMDSATLTAASQGDPGESDSAALTTTALPVYGLSLAPQAQAASGNPGGTLEYTLHLTNTGNTTDTFDLAYSGNAWDVLLPFTQTTLAAGATTEVIVHVAIPAGAADGAQDTTTITATSQGDATQVATSTLTSTAMWHKVYLPVVIKP